jgi:patatin-like phospholipase/acyl hydrolase
MQEVQRLRQDDEVPLPCQYFDLMGGTSTGGLIAIMLGRLRMVHFKIICFRVAKKSSLWMNALKNTPTLQGCFPDRQRHQGSSRRSQSMSFQRRTS